MERLTVLLSFCVSQIYIRSLLSSLTCLGRLNIVFFSPSVFSRTEGGCEVRLRAAAKQKAKVLGADCRARVWSGVLLPAVWRHRPALGRKSNAIDLFVKKQKKRNICCRCFSTSGFIRFVCLFGRRCLEFAFTRASAAGLPSGPCWCLRMWRWALSWCSPILQTALLPEKTESSCWRPLTSTGRFTSHLIDTHQKKINLS